MSVGRTAIAAIIYASLMIAWAWHDGDPFRGSYLLGFVFYAVLFGILFHFLMKWIDRRKWSKTE
ncbi:MAG: hypothetical protein K5799_03080 [Erythrobacter sp.]|nr:hypothetical protein [Erythrobacter sp.]